jgi:hypothetical protein
LAGGIVKRTIIVLFAVALVAISGVRVHDYYIHTPSSMLRQLQKAAEREDEKAIAHDVNINLIAYRLMQPIKDALESTQNSFHQSLETARKHVQAEAEKSGTVYAFTWAERREHQLFLEDTEMKTATDNTIEGLDQLLVARITDYFQHFDSCTVLRISQNGDTAKAFVKAKDGTLNTLALTKEHDRWVVTGADIGKDVLDKTAVQLEPEKKN